MEKINIFQKNEDENKTCFLIYLSLFKKKNLQYRKLRYR